MGPFFSDFQFPVFLGAALLGAALCAGYVYFEKKTAGRFVRALIEQSCTGEDSAKTLRQLGFSPNGLLSARLKRPSSLTMLVRQTDETEARYYIEPRHLDKARAAYGAKGATLLAVLLCLLAFAAVFAAVYLLLPYLV